VCRSAMRILQLTKSLSPRADSGFKLRTYGLGLALSTFAEVDIMGFSDGGSPASLADAPRLRHYRNRYAVEMERGLRRTGVVAASRSARRVSPLPPCAGALPKCCHSSATMRCKWRSCR
jgi:hypothetical protein